MKIKFCRKCQKETEFYENGGCRKCTREYQKKYYLEHYAPPRPLPLPDGYKKCGRCKEIKQLNRFYRDKSESDGYHHHCKECSDEIKRIRLGRAKTNIKMSPKGYRKCRVCKLSKPLSEYESRKAANCRGCNEVRRQYLEDMRTTAKERHRAYDKEWKKNPDYQAQQRNYRIGYNQRPEVKAKNHQYNLAYRNHPENQEKARAKTIEWRKRNVDKTRYQAQVKRTRKLNAEGTYTFEQWRMLLSFFDACPRCGKQNILTVDHIIPLSKGGTNYLDNLQPLCRSCNSSKNAHLIIDYRPAHVRRWAFAEMSFVAIY